MGISIVMGVLDDLGVALFQQTSTYLMIYIYISLFFKGLVDLFVSYVQDFDVAFSFSIGCVIFLGCIRIGSGTLARRSSSEILHVLKDG